jgi:L-threonylcarbamoyladenylate synthase
VAFPTETVYGLGADATNAAAVRKIFAAKGRPADNPLIVHISNVDELRLITPEVTTAAEKLIAAYWPGPLTIVLRKTPIIPDEVTCGLDTVGIRLPADKTARRLIAASGVPIAAPSANKSGRPSPTRAEHVLRDLDGKIDMILDGGATVFGLESTVVDALEDVPRLLRPGSVTAEMLRETCGNLVSDIEAYGVPPSPGMKYRHYAPRARLTLVIGEPESAAQAINKILRAKTPGVTAGVLASAQTAGLYDKTRHVVLAAGDRNRPETAGANLFALLREFDERNVREIFAESLEETGAGLAVMNRLKKAAAEIIRL